MKKRVRIYKARGQSDAPTQEDIYKYIADTMSADDYDGDTDAISEKLTQAGIDPETADAYIDEVDTYLKENNPEEVVDNGEITPEEQKAKQIALEEQNAAEEKARQAQLYAMYNTNTEEDVPDDNADEEIISRYGGAKPSKRSFINQYTKLAKKAERGNTPSPGSDDVLNGREDIVKGFQNALQGSAQDAILRQEAEAQYHYAYGGVKMGEFEDGGINQEQIDPENPLHHLSTYGADTRHIFSDNMYTQNDIAALEQYGGNTGQGLYKFIGGGDNELMDEQYQDSDLDYQRYARHGGSLHKYIDEGEVTEASLVSPIDGHTYSDEEIAANKEQTDKTADTEDYKKKYNELIAQNTTATTAAQKEQQMMQQYMMQQYMQQMGQGMFRSPIISRGEQYNQAVGSPYYTESGEKYTGPDLAGRLPSSVNVDKYGIFGRPKKMTYNYGATPKIASFKAPTYTPGQSNVNNTSMGDSSDESYRGKTFGERLGRGMVNTKIPGIQQLGAKLIPWADVPNAPNKDWSDTINKFKEKFPKFNDFGNKKTYGGPVDYTQYAYGGDVSIPELYKAQTGFETNVDGCPWGSTKDYKGDCVDGQGNVTKKANTDFKMAEPKKLLENPFSQPKKNPLTGETPGVQVDSSGNYINEGIKYGDQENVSQKFRNKQAWDISKKGIGDLSLLVGNAAANITDEVTANRQENQLLENTTSAESNYGINNAYDQGDYDPNSGLFRPNKMGFNGVSKYGGGVYATGGNIEDEDEDTQYMTQEEIDEFLANGGELEFY